MQNPTLMIIPAYLDSFGGITVSLALLAKGFQALKMTHRLRVLVRPKSLLETYFIDHQLENCLEIIPRTKRGFLNEAIRWAHQQPLHWPLLLDNSVWRSRLPKLLRASFPLRMSQRPIYHFCHDLALSDSPLGFLARKLTFTCLNPKVICNSQFTADHVRQIMPNVKGILYQPVDLEKINRCQNDEVPPPTALVPIIKSGARIILTPSRINKPGIVNDKNLRAMIPVVAALKQKGHHYHSVVIGEDSSEDKRRTQDLLNQAKNLGVADRFTILPPTFSIEPYYRYADVVVTLAPREPFGRTVVEAIAQGVPVIGANTGGVNEILQNVAPHWTVNPHHPGAVAEHILQAVADAHTPDTLAQGRQWIEQHCSLEAYARGMMQLVDLWQASDRDETVLARAG